METKNILGLFKNISNNQAIRSYTFIIPTGIPTGRGGRVKTATLTLGYFPGQYVKVDGKWKGYVLDCGEKGVTTLATSGNVGIHTLDPRLHDIKVLADRTPEGIKFSHNETMRDNIKMGILVLVPLSLYIGFAVSMPFLGIAGMGFVLITAAYLEDKYKEGWN